MDINIRCKFCNRKITNQKYITIQAGPICARRHGLTVCVPIYKTIPKPKTQIIQATREKQTELLISELVKNSPFKKKVFSIGGFVRDELLGKESKDLDLVVSQQNGSEQFGKYIHSLFPEETTAAYQMGESYPIWRLAFKKDIKYHGQEYQTAGVEIDIADTQKESFPDSESRQRVSTYGTLDEDIYRRDFTCNMLLRDLTTGKIIDKTGIGVHDIKNGILRGHPSVSLDKVFSDDPLRMIRLIRFQSRYGWKIPYSVIKSVKKNADRVSIVSVERVREELLKIITTGRFSKSINFMKISGLLEYILPEINLQKKADFKKTLWLIENAEKSEVVQLAALLIKIESDESRNSKNSVTMSILRKMKIETDTGLKVKKVLDAQSKTLYLGNNSSIKELRQYIRECGSELDPILDLANTTQKQEGVNFIPELRLKIKEALSIPIREKSILDGDEIMKLLNIKPGPKIRKIMVSLIELEDEYAERKDLFTKEVAISILKSRKYD